MRLTLTLSLVSMLAACGGDLTELDQIGGDAEASTESALTGCTLTANTPLKKDSDTVRGVGALICGRVTSGTMRTCVQFYRDGSWNSDGCNSDGYSSQS